MTIVKNCCHPVSFKGVAMQSCPHYESCNAVFCPLDPELEKRVWIPALEHEVCKYRKVNKRNWVKKQRSILRRQTKSWFKPTRDYPDGKPITFKLLWNASRPRVLSPEHRQRLSDRMISRGQKAETVSCICGQI